MTEDHITKYLCINCPLGCHLEVEEDEKDNIVDVRGWGCKRGDKYARQEHTDPRRMVTTTVSVSNGTWARLPVRTSEEIVKVQIMDVCNLLQKTNVTAPIKMGDVIVSNILDSGVDIVASRDMPVV
jgi:CxxC motif-containing protein